VGKNPASAIVQPVIKRAKEGLENPRIGKLVRKKEAQTAK